MLIGLYPSFRNVKLLGDKGSVSHGQHHDLSTQDILVADRPLQEVFFMDSSLSVWASFRRMEEILLLVLTYVLLDFVVTK